MAHPANEKDRLLCTSVLNFGPFASGTSSSENLARDFCNEVAKQKDAAFAKENCRGIPLGILVYIFDTEAEAREVHNNGLKQIVEQWLPPGGTKAEVIEIASFKPGNYGTRQLILSSPKNRK